MIAGLSVSNIAWRPDEEAAVLPLLRAQGFTGVEVAPSVIWPDWEGATPGAAVKVAQHLADEGFTVPALQAILYGRPDHKLFADAESRQRTLDHLAFVAELGAALGAKIMVFGSPGNRDRGDLSPEDAFERGVAFFSEAAELCAARGVSLGLEANPSVYKCNFLTHWHEAAAMVEAVDSPGLRLHLDTACTHLEGDSPVEAIGKAAARAAHFHVSEPQLSDLSAPVLDHAEIGAALKASGYSGWVSVEMRRSDDPLKSIGEAVAKVAVWYGDRSQARGVG